MICAELALCNYGVLNAFQFEYSRNEIKVEKYFVRCDDYSIIGDDLLKQMVEGGFRVYPAEEVNAMKLWVTECADFGYQEGDINEDDEEYDGRYVCRGGQRASHSCHRLLNFLRCCVPQM